MRYAIGEIVLVVIGILIALSINNWNENSKLKIQEVGILHDFHESLQNDLHNLNLNMSLNERIKKSIPILLTHMEQDLPYQDSLKFHFANITSVWKFDLNESVFESLRSKDLNLISNKDLRQKVINVYGRLNSDAKDTYERYFNAIDDASKNILNTRFETFWVSNYESWKIDNNSFGGIDPSKVIGEMVPIDYEQLRLDQEFIYFLTSLQNRYNWLMEVWADGLRLAIETLILDIENELKVLENK